MVLLSFMGYSYNVFKPTNIILNLQAVPLILTV